jgi:hypothetical protein
VGFIAKGAIFRAKTLRSKDAKNKESKDFGKLKLSIKLNHGQQ